MVVATSIWGIVNDDDKGRHIDMLDFVIQVIRCRMIATSVIIVGDWSRGSKLCCATHVEVLNNHSDDIYRYACNCLYCCSLCLEIVDRPFSMLIYFIFLIM